jgi:hypothetical protein
MGLSFLLEEICGPILGIYKSLTDTWMWKLKAEAAQFPEKEYIDGIAVAVYSDYIKTFFTTYKKCTACLGCDVTQGDLLMPYFPPLAFDFSPETGLNRELGSGSHR